LSGGATASAVTALSEKGACSCAKSAAVYASDAKLPEQQHMLSVRLLSFMRFLSIPIQLTREVFFAVAANSCFDIVAAPRHISRWALRWLAIISL